MLAREMVLSPIARSAVSSANPVIVNSQNSAGAASGDANPIVDAAQPRLPPSRRGALSRCCRSGPTPRRSSSLGPEHRSGDFAEVSEAGVSRRDELADDHVHGAVPSSAPITFLPVL
jgi:hypothetical protein